MRSAARYATLSGRVPRPPAVVDRPSQGIPNSAGIGGGNKTDRSPVVAVMPAITADTLTLPRVTPPGPTDIDRPVRFINTGPRGHEGEGFPVVRAFAGVSSADLDPFVHMDQMGEVDYEPGQPRGTDWHPHRGFETVTYMIDGRFAHQDSHGGGGLITDGATQWMTAGAGILHIETPPLSEHAGALLDGQGRQDCLSLSGGSLCACRRTAPEPVAAVRGRARELLQRADVREHATPALLVAFDVRSAASCEARLAELPRAEKDGDERTIAVLTMLSSNTKKGCGWKKRRPCPPPCAKQAAAFRDAAAQIRSRLEK